MSDATMACEMDDCLNEASRVQFGSIGNEVNLCDEHANAFADERQCSGPGPHIWTDTGTNLVCECCGSERGQ